jgi:hypothetical protein
MRTTKYQIFILLVAVALAGIAPLLFPVAQAGIASLSGMATTYLLPSAILLLATMGVAYITKARPAASQIANGLVAGMIATVALEIIRITGFKLGGMPGDMPKLLGVLLLDQFAQGPDLGSNVAGWIYHFWNGAAFGIIYSILAGRGKIWTGILFGILVGIGFMVSPVTRALGIGAFGLEFKDGYQFLTTVTLAHIAFGLVLGWIIQERNRKYDSLFKQLRNLFYSA